MKLRSFKFFIQSYEGFKLDSNLILLCNHFNLYSPLSISWEVPILGTQFDVGRPEMPLVVLDGKPQLQLAMISCK